MSDIPETVTPETETPTISYQKWYENNIKRVTDKADEAYRASVNNAQLTYEQALGAYGTNAERLASMGLSNSGYSDYLKTRAYDTYRSEVSAAEKLRSDTIADAELTYGEMLLGKQETQKTNDLSSYVTNAGNGLYTSNKIETIISENGYTGADADAIRGAFKEYENQKLAISTTISNSIANNEFATWSAVENYAKSQGLDPKTFKGQYITNIYDEISTELSYGGMLNDALMTELQSLDGAKYDEIKQKYNEAQDTSEAGFKKDGVLVSKDEAKNIIKAIDNNKYLSAETKRKYKDTYNTLYCAEVVSNAVVTQDTNKNRLALVRDIGYGEEVIAYIPQFEESIKDPNVIEAAKKLPSQRVFRLNGEVYYKMSGGEIVKLEGNIGDVFNNYQTSFYD